MRVCYFYAKPFDQAVAALPANADLAFTGDSPAAYWQAIEARWGAGDDLLFVEQDIVLHETVLSQLSECSEDRCIFPYIFGRGPAVNLSGPNIITRSIGCTRFSAALQAKFSTQDIFNHPKSVAFRAGCTSCTPTAICWVHIDQSINRTIERDNDPHMHGPFVEHLHFEASPEPESVVADEEEYVEMVLTLRQP